MLRADRRASKIGMKNRPGPIDHHAHVRRMHGGYRHLHPLRKMIDPVSCLCFLIAFADISAKLVHLYVDGLHHRLAAIVLNHRLDGLIFQQHVNFRDAAVQHVLVHRSYFLPSS